MICFSLASVISDYFRLDICDILFFSADWIGNVTKVRASKMPWKGPLFDQLRYRNDIAFQYFRCTQLLAEAISLIISILHIYIYYCMAGHPLFKFLCTISFTKTLAEKDAGRTSPVSNLAGYQPLRHPRQARHDYAKGPVLGVSRGSVILNSVWLDFRSTSCKNAWFWLNLSWIINLWFSRYHNVLDFFRWWLNCLIQVCIYLLCFFDMTSTTGETEEKRWESRGFILRFCLPFDV